MAGEQAVADFLRCSTTELPELALWTGIEPVTYAVSSEVTATYATG
jgi:hypothetical protein